MPLVIHLTPEKNVAAIRRGGIRALKWASGVYVMPVLRNFVVSHQWVRELRRFHAGRTMRAVYVRLPDDEPVLLGHYSQKPALVTAARAAETIMHAADPLGMQIIVPRRIAAKEIHAIRDVPQTVGWRYSPAAHGRFPCGCDYCQWRGKYGSRDLRKRFGP